MVRCLQQFNQQRSEAKGDDMIKAIAHRGYASKFPENTLAAFAGAIEMEFETIELDVHLSADKVPVVIHDATVDRVTNGIGEVSQYTVAELKELIVLNEEKIPTLNEVLTHFKGSVRFAIELKNEKDRYPDIEKHVLNVISTSGVMESVYVISFNHNSIDRLRGLSKSIELGYIKRRPTPALFKRMKKNDIKSVSMNYIYFSKKLVKLVKHHQLQLVVYNMEKKRQMKRVLRYPSVRSTVKDLALFRSLYKKRDSMYKM